MSGGFVDLRRGPETERAHEGFWPSFTDLMMVVMMIFMIASTVLILRNWDLVDELRETIEAEHRATEMVRTTTEVNATLEEQLAQLQHQLSVLRMQLMQAEETRHNQEQALAARDRMIVALETERDQLQNAGHSTQRQLQAANEEIERLRLRQQETRQQLQAAQASLSELEQAHQQQTAELGALRQQDAESRRLLSNLQGDYDSLKTKYDKLVRPARTAKGKYVVEVRYEKIDGQYRISYREPGQTTYRELSRPQLEARLGELKKQDPDRLYVKIVIPADSGLSYIEAWNFTKELLDRYDYYHD